MKPVGTSIVDFDFDTNGDRYVLDEDEATNGSSTFRIYLFRNGSDTSVDLCVDISEPHGLAAHNGDVYVIDGDQILKLSRT